MSNLRRTIQQLAEDFAARVLKVLSTTSLSDLTSMTSGPPTRAASVAAAGVGAAKGGARSVRRVRKGERRSAGDLQGTIEAIVAALKKNSEGLRSEQIQKELRLSKKDVTRPLQLALANKSIRKKGQKRATTYFAA